MKEFFTGVTQFVKSHLAVSIACGVVIVAAVVSLIIFLPGRSAGDLHESESFSDVLPDDQFSVPEPTLPTPTPSPVPTLTPTPEPVQTDPSHEGEVISVLDGSWVSEEVAKARPFAIMFNNIGAANPQSGIGDAKILYEALAEGGITRLMGVFEGLTEESSCKDRLGSVRSARHYFASFADEYDAVFVHFGETTYATKKIKKLKLDHLEGTYAIGDTVFYRDKTIKAPHNAFASLEGILKGIEKSGIRAVHNDDFKPNHFVFNTVPAVLQNGESASIIKLDYSTYMNPYFVYDGNTGKYTRYQFDDVHIDKNTEQPLTFDNLIIQLVKEWNKDENGYQDMDIEDSEGNGWYITGGKCVPITWKKNEKQRSMFYYDENGEVLSINPGRTFISVFPNSRSDKIVIE